MDATAHCSRLAAHLTRLAAMPHTTDADTARTIRDHTTLGCPACSGYEVPSGLARDPRDDPKESR